MAAESVVGVWPDNVLPLNVFLCLGTQWRVGPGGVVGLDYNVIPLAMRRHAVPRAKWGQVLDDIQAMEAHALSIIHK